MSWVSRILGGAAKEPIQAVFDGLDNLVTSDEERAAAELLKLKAVQEPDKLQVELNKIEAGHRSIFVAGWRPSIGWVCAAGLLFAYIFNPVLQYAGLPPVDVPLDNMSELVMAMLGLGALRTVEKMNGRAK